MFNSLTRIAEPLVPASLTLMVYALFELRLVRFFKLATAPVRVAVIMPVVLVSIAFKSVTSELDNAVIDVVSPTVAEVATTCEAVVTKAVLT